ncbi:MAG: 50S ribosomal protein L10 [Candidatus Omnitrophica bacterium]|nr:50S ribosomal protein L10 [Candidatus Omnitrophota bacterium]
MAKISKECKKIIVKEISEKFDSADSLIVTNYKGLSAHDLDELRRELRGISGKYLVVKDSMAKKALDESRNSKISEFIEGEVGIAVDKKTDAVDISKVLVKFSKEHKSLKIRGGVMGGELISMDDIKRLATLPSREVLLGNLANVLNAPIQGLAGVLNAIICKFLYALNAVKDKKAAAPQAKPKEEDPAVEKTETIEPEKQEEKKEEL